MGPAAQVHRGGGWAPRAGLLPQRGAYAMPAVLLIRPEDKSFLPDPKVYPIAWEVMLDGVYFDGKKLPNSTLSSSTIELSALIDTVCLPHLILVVSLTADFVRVTRYFAGLPMSLRAFSSHSVIRSLARNLTHSPSRSAGRCSPSIRATLLARHS